MTDLMTSPGTVFTTATTPSITTTTSVRGITGAPPFTQQALPCPGCGHPAAAHVGFEEGEPTAIRVVCGSGCADNDFLRVAAIDALYPIAQIA